MPITEVTVWDANGDNEISLLVEFSYYGGCCGARDSLGGVPGAGPPLEPDEPPEIEIIHVWDMNNNKYSTTAEEDEQIEERLWDEISNS